MIKVDNQSMSSIKNNEINDNENKNKNVTITDNKQMDKVLTIVFILFISSIDNFIVGMSLGTSNVRLSLRSIFIISTITAVGTSGSSLIGTIIGEYAPNAVSIMAFVVFTFLGYQELSAYYSKKSSFLNRLSMGGSIWKLSLPMTLDNLVAGVACGLIGISPLFIGFSAFITYFLMMLAGLRVGNTLRQSSSIYYKIKPKLLSGILFISIAVKQLWDIVNNY